MTDLILLGIYLGGAIPAGILGSAIFISQERAWIDVEDTSDQLIIGLIGLCCGIAWPVMAAAGAIMGAAIVLGNLMGKVVR